MNERVIEIKYISKSLEVKSFDFIILCILQASDYFV